jgi:hypothetical protein
LSAPPEAACRTSTATSGSGGCGSSRPQTDEVDDLAFAVVARDRRIERVALEVELVGKERGDDTGVTESAPVGVDDRLRSRLGGQRAVAEQGVEEAALLRLVGGEAVALLGVEDLGRQLLGGEERLPQERHVLAALPIGERGRFVHGCPHGIGDVQRAAGRRAAGAC